jgi:hypothetical protein
MDRFEMERIEYKLKKQVANIVTGSDGVIFGGYVRDMIRHDYMCERFYAAHKDGDGFSDPCIEPDTADRLLIPADIDCHFGSMEGYKGFVANLRQANFHVRIKMNRSMYTPDDDDATHIKLSVSVPSVKSALLHSMPASVARDIVIRMNLSSEILVKVEIDVIIHPTKSPPFSGLDFYCNGLVMSSEHGVSLCESLKKETLFPMDQFKMLNSIVSDIQNKVARVHCTKPDRVKKMVRKGWNIMGDTIERVIKSDEMCILCHDVCQPDNHYKLSCCSAGYHGACLSRAVTYFMDKKSACMHCQAEYTFIDPSIIPS